jgi:UDP-3-O-[3-hydroxymyristoyl] glucosamine N-acyltransferase
MPVTKKHLLLALDWVEGKIRPGFLKGACYDQAEWDCGTSCCIHGAARRFERNEDPQCTVYSNVQPGDYSDLEETIRNGILSVMHSPRCENASSLIRRILEKELVIGKNVFFGSCVYLGENCVVRDSAVIGDYANVGSKVTIEEGCVVPYGSTVPNGSTITVENQNAFQFLCVR